MRVEHDSNTAPCLWGYAALQVPLHVDDLVSSKYLDVASSGYGVAAPPRAPSDTRQQAGPQQQQGTWADQGATLQHWLPAAGPDPLSSPWGDQLPQLTAGQSLESGWGLAGAQTLFAMHPSGAMVPVMLPQPTLAPPLQPAPQQQPQQPRVDDNQRRGHAGAGDLGKGAQGRGGRKKVRPGAYHGPAGCGSWLPRSSPACALVHWHHMAASQTGQRTIDALLM